MKPKHFLLLSLPAQSHINPTLQLAKILTRHGAHVTFATTISGLSRLNSLPTIPGLSYATFSDGSTDEQQDDKNQESKDDSKPKVSTDDYVSVLRRVGPQNVSKLVQDLSKNESGYPVSFIVYTVILSWVAEVARDMHIPSAFLFIQCAVSFTIFHRFFNSHDGINSENDNFTLDMSLKLSGLPPFTAKDLPSFLLPGNDFHSSMSPTFREHIQTLEKDPNRIVLINTFDELEKHYINSDCYNIIPIGPLLPSAFTDKNDLDDKSFGGHMFQTSENTDYITWLDTKSDASVVYVSFGSLVVLKESQKDEIFQCLLESKRPFLWVIRDIKTEDVKEKYGDIISEELGLIVPWCSQVEVLSHRATGCFVTHCGWNSTLESLMGGVPVLGCPNFSDQSTNMKVIEELWGNGVRVKENEEGVFAKEEIRRCLDIVMGEGEGEEGEEIRRNAVKWKGLAVEAAEKGGSSYQNLLRFLEM